MQKTGRPAISDKDAETIFRKLEPYLKTGLSLHKACLQAQIPKTSVYQLCAKVTEFSERIDSARNHHTVLVTDIFTSQLTRIHDKQKSGQLLTPDDIKFVQWMALNSKSMRDEYGTDMELTIEDKKREREEEMKQTLINDPHALITVLKTYEHVRNRIINGVSDSPDIDSSLVRRE